jgi:hypothetical protein
MLKPEKVAEVKRLLAERGKGTWPSLRAIARRTGVSRAKVSQMAHGKRPDYESRRQPDPEPDGPTVRCTTCGGMVQLPCLRCRLEANGIQASREDGDDGPIRIELKGPAKRRYQSVRDGKADDGEPADEAVYHGP